MEVIKQPWPWYIGGVLIGLSVPALLIVGNKLLGVSSALRHVCAACFPANIDFLKYDWRKQTWSLLFAAGIIIGGFIGGRLMANLELETISPQTIEALGREGIRFNKGFLPEQIFSWEHLFTLHGFLVIVVGGFLIGFGTRYAGGCTSGHGITGLSSLQWPSLIAFCSFFAAGIVSAKYLLPFILKL
jgi:uncharacterized membrane protein YedE/YeeE